MNKFLFLALIGALAFLTACASQAPREPTARASVTLRAEDQSAWQASGVLIKQQKWQEAKLALQNLIKTNPKFTGIVINLAAVECQLQQWQAAAKLLGGLSEADKTPEVFNLLGVVAEHSGQMTQAEQYYLTAVNSPQAPAEALYNLALLYDIYWQDPQKALPFYQAYVNARPEDKVVVDWINEIKRKTKH